jgi:hypothetical protein
MLIPRSHAWSPSQKRLIAAGIVAGLACVSAGIYLFERYHGLPSDSVLFGTWYNPGDSSPALCYDFKPDHTLQLRACDEPEPILRGRWYAGGNNIYGSFTGEDADFLHLKRPVILHIVDIEPDTLRITKLLNGAAEAIETYRRFPLRASNQSLQPTASPGE